ncbi:hypothetical protein ASPCADRAFT_206152, partial [Aspergillus carbonarius ITEM 5010]
MYPGAQLLRLIEPYGDTGLHLRCRNNGYSSNARALRFGGFGHIYPISQLRDRVNPQKSGRPIKPYPSVEI